MDLSGLIVQFLNGLAEASSLFLVAAGLSLIFGVTRIVNFAHGSLYMLGIYVAYTVVQSIGHTPLGFWFAIIAAALLVGALGALIEIILLRRIYRAPELFQLLATFALVLVINDATLWIWGPEDLLGPVAPGLNGSIQVLGRYLPKYDIALIVIGPLVLGLLWVLLRRTRWGTLVRAATQDREMLGALGVNQAWLFTGVFALGSFLAALGGAAQIPRLPANLTLDLSVIGDAFVVVVVGGMGSIPGAYIAALIIAELKALCIALGTVDIFGISFAFPKLTLVVEFIFMAIVLVFRPWGLFGKVQAASRNSAPIEAPLRPSRLPFKVFIAVVVVALALVPSLSNWLPYGSVLMLDIIVAALFALSLHFMMGPGGMHSFGHAAYFGLGAYGAALLLKAAAFSMGWSIALAPLIAGVGALVFGWFCVRLSGIYLAMLTLAFGQIVWSVVYQWDEFTGGSNGVVGVWPASWLEGDAYYYFSLGVVLISAIVLRRILFSSFGYAMRASRDSTLRADALGINVKRVQWVGFVIAGIFAGLAGALFVFSKGGASPEIISVSKSVDGLVMVLLGGVQTLLGPAVGAAVFKVLQDYFMGITEYWHALFGGVILLLVLAFPQGIAGYFKQLFETSGGNVGAVGRRIGKRGQNELA
ncbi:MAG TPA: ABC transporter permease [Eoetvoesiella sp.]|jgi:branched-chain amino acid transport system permease protein|uniref:ABC transporter permease n=1 Tax=Eoetvoesiella sp. TaxID=1966355 RepID=UPI002BD8E92C|nr:ABC transporter permease [Eoetvoesiella sp.]HWK60750.1 ABC transporter permease [Eoetvoesiella sp.]